MKIRTDFVTNSSSSSFVVFGMTKDNIKVKDEVYLDMFKAYVAKNHSGKYYRLADVDITKMSDADKIEWAKDYYEGEEVFNQGLIRIGGQDYDEVGISPTSLIHSFPDAKLGDVYKIVAEEFNKTFGTNFTDKDIDYFESGWYDG